MIPHVTQHILVRAPGVCSDKKFTLSNSDQSSYFPFTQLLRLQPTGFHTGKIMKILENMTGSDEIALLLL